MHFQPLENKRFNLSSTQHTQRNEETFELLYERRSERRENGVIIGFNAKTKQNSQKLRNHCQHKKNQLQHRKNKLNLCTIISQPQDLLIEELRKQVEELYPLNKTFNNLLHYYKQLILEYQALLQQRDSLNCMGQLEAMSQRKIQKTNHQLRQTEIEYQQLSDYFNLHLIPKLYKNNQTNKMYCQTFTRLDSEADKIKERVRSQLMLRQIMKDDHQKVVKEIQPQKGLCSDLLVQVGVLKKYQLDSVSSQKEVQQKLIILKGNQQARYKEQSQLLSNLSQKKQNNNRLTIEHKSLQDKLKLAQQLHAQRSLRCSQLIKKKQSTVDRQVCSNEALQSALSQSQSLQNKLIQIQNILSQKQTQLESITVGQIPNEQKQICQLQKQNQKTIQFLQYLKSYQFQLQQTSKLMFQNLNHCCKQDYQKLVKNKSPSPQRSTLEPQVLISQENKHQQNILKNHNYNSAPSEIVVQIQNPYFIFDKESVQKLIQQRKHLKTLSYSFL